MNFQSAGVADILRTTQKDEQFIDRYNNALVEFLRLITNNNESKIKRYSTYLSEIAYYTLTSLSNLQTLGEEYTTILRFKPSANNIPSKFIQVLWLVSFVCGKDAFRKMIVILENQTKKENLSADAKVAILNALRILKENEEFIVRLHLAVFYIQKRYYNISNRITSIQYVSWMKNEEFSKAFNVLGVISLCYLLGKVMYDIFSVNKSRFSVEKPVSDCEPRTVKECFLCAEEKINATTLSCGHYFCWNCVFELIDVRKRCPICREYIDRNCVVMLENF